MSVLGFKQGEPIPDHVLRKMHPSDRPKGKAGMTSEEALLKATAKTERDLQNLVWNYLKLRGVRWVGRQSMAKKSQLAIGTPDFLFMFHGYPFAVETKVPNAKLTPDQLMTHLEMSLDGWRVRVIRSLEEMKQLLDSYP